MKIRQSAFSGEGSLLKGALHCHTTRSDSSVSPEVVAQQHIDHGYNFLAITDHRVYNRKNPLPESSLLIVPAMEIDGTIVYEDGTRRCFHSVCLGPDDDTNGFSHDQRWGAPYRVNDQLEFQEHLDAVHKNNNITFYCHPDWSATPTRYFDRLEGEFGIEVWNTGCVLDNDMDKDAPCWDELLGMGKRMWGLAVDDGHSFEQNCKGWVMVNADKNVASILAALKEGAFYSSCGPVIKDFYVEDDCVVIKTDGCVSFSLFTDKHPTVVRRFSADDPQEEVRIRIGANRDYVRMSVLNAKGERAWTNPIFLK